MAKQYNQLLFPAGGVHRRLAFQQAPPFTTPDALNVRTDDLLASRERGGSRPGLARYAELGAMVLDNPVRLIADVAYVSGGAYAQKVVASSNEKLYYDNAGTWTEVGGGPPQLMSDRMLTAADHLQKLYIAGDTGHADSPRLCVFDPAGNTLALVVASMGTVPVKCDLVCQWRDRIVLAGDRDNPHLWYMSKSGDPTNWDYSPGSTTSLDAVSATNSDAGRIGEPIRALIPHTDQCMLFGCSSSVWALVGDPQFGGSLFPINYEVGVLDRAGWCYDSEGNLWLFTQDGLYAHGPGCPSRDSKLVSVSREKLPAELLRIDRDAYTVSMTYDFFARGIHLFVTKTSGSTGVGHWFIDTRVTRAGDRVTAADAAFWPQSFQTTHEPTAVFARRDYVPASSGLSPVLLGGRDGYVRQFNDALAQDDGDNAITSYVDFGPVPLGATGYHGRLEEVQVVGANGSGNLKLAVRVGNNAEEAYSATRQEEYILTRNGLNRTVRPRARGNAALLRIQGTEANTKWSVEAMDIRREQAGVRRV
jgi:hypothetical protein